MVAYDTDPVGALTEALKHVLQTADADWASLIALCGFSPSRAGRLIARDVRALDELAAELNEMRTIG